MCMVCLDPHPSLIFKGVLKEAERNQLELPLRLPANLLVVAQCGIPAVCGQHGLYGEMLSVQK